MRAILFRLWIVLTIIWVGYGTYECWVTYQKSEVERYEAEEWRHSSTLSNTEVARLMAINNAMSHEKRKEMYLQAIASNIEIMIGIPIALLLLFPISSFVLGGRTKKTP